MNALLLRNYIRRAASLQSFKEYRASELQAGAGAASVTSDGTLLEFETLELRLHPPNVVIDNDSYDEMTVITIDSANRPGTLIEVVQCLTELNLSIRKARISSDGGWFVDEFFVTETPKGKVTHQKKLETIRKVLSVGSDPSSDLSVVFELSGRDQRGLLAAVLSTLTAHQCDVQSVAVWTYHNQVALVVGVIDRQQQPQQLMGSGRHGSHSALGPGMMSHVRGGHIGAGSASVGGVAGHSTEPDPAKMQNLAQVLVSMLGGEGLAHVSWEVVQGDIHHERRLHHLLLQEEERCWETQQVVLSAAPSLTSHTSLSGAPSLVTNTPTGAQGRTSNSSSGGYPSIGPGPTSNGGAATGHTSGVGAITPPAISPRAPTAAPTATAAIANGNLQPVQPDIGGAAFVIPAEGSEQRQSSFASVQQQQQVLMHQSSQLSNSTVAAEEPAAAGDAGKNTAQRSLQHALSGLTTFPSGGGYVPAPTAVQSSEMLQGLQGYVEASSVRADVRIQHSPLLKYYLVTITCKDRNKLFFDTVCTLADMQYDVYHGAIDSENDQASQLFYVRPRSGELILAETRLRQLAYMLECAVQRRFPSGLRVHMQAPDRAAVPGIFTALSNAGFSITRAEVRALSDGRAFMDLTMTDGSGQVPSAGAVQRACEAAGGVAADELHPLMAVAGVGGAAAAAATGLARSSMYPQHFHAPSPLSSTAPASAAAPGGGLPPTGAPARQPQPQQVQQYAPSGAVLARTSAVKFQFAISASVDRRSRGPLGHAASSTSGAGTLL